MYKESSYVEWPFPQRWDVQLFASRNQFETSQMEVYMHMFTYMCSKVDCSNNIFQLKSFMLAISNPFPLKDLKTQFA